jgi:hypothetical protein
MALLLVEQNTCSGKCIANEEYHEKKECKWNSHRAVVDFVPVMTITWGKTQAATT